MWILPFRRSLTLPLGINSVVMNFFFCCCHFEYCTSRNTFFVNLFVDVFQKSLCFSIHILVCFVFYGILYWWSLLFCILKVLHTHVINLMPFLYFLIFYVSARSALHLLSNHKGIFCIRNRNICIFLLWNLFLLNNVILNNFLCCFIKKETINPTSLTVIFSGIISNMHFLSNSTFKCNCSSAMTSTPALQNLIFAEVFGIIKNLCPLQLNILSCD